MKEQTDGGKSAKILHFKEGIGREDRRMNNFPGYEPIPSEQELMEMYQVSRITVRKAVDELVNEGYLYKIQGKGTYVKTMNAATIFLLSPAAQKMWCGWE